MPVYNPALVMQWHTRNGGHKGKASGHALRHLGEAFELAFAAGATEDEVHSVYATETQKAVERGEDTGEFHQDRFNDEMADTGILWDILVGYHCPAADSHKAGKLKVLHTREWGVDSEGVLWRPGRMPPDKRVLTRAEYTDPSNVLSHPDTKKETDNGKD